MKQFLKENIRNAQIHQHIRMCRKCQPIFWFHYFKHPMRYTKILLFLKEKNYKTIVISCSGDNKWYCAWKHPKYNWTCTKLVQLCVFIHPHKVIRL